MRFSELFLRLGSGLVAWMLLYAYVFWLAALHTLACGPDGDELHRLLLGIAPLAVAAGFSLRVTRPLHEVHAILRWLRVPLFLFVPFCLRSIWDAIEAVHLMSVSLCGSLPLPTWQTFWSPLQLICLLLLGYNLLTVWRSDKTNAHKNN